MDMKIQSLAHTNFLPVPVKQHVKALTNALVDNHVWYQINKDLEGAYEKAAQDCEYLFDEIDRVLNPFLTGDDLCLS
jgi:hypothetical protein